MKQIEKGCMAIIINSKAGNDGKVVTVGDFIGDTNIVDGFLFIRGRRWNINTKIKFSTGRYFSHIAESRLLRIDGHKQTEGAKDEKVKVVS